MIGLGVLSTEVIGVPVSAGSLAEVGQHIFENARSGKQGYVCVANVHMLVSARRDPEFFKVLDGASVITTDGMPLVWELQRKGFTAAERVAGQELTSLLLSLAEKALLPVFFYGGSHETWEIFEQKIRSQFPALLVVGNECPPILPTRPSVDEELVARIRNSGARLVFVGLGCPKQEFWMAAHEQRLDAVMVGVGAVFDFMSGKKQRAPIWMQKAGLEWFYRLCNEPNRLWRRYLSTNTRYLFYLLAVRLGSLRSR